MTWNDYFERVWRAAGFSDSEIAKATANNEAMHPGFGQQPAQLNPAYTEQQAIDSIAASLRSFLKLPDHERQEAEAALNKIIQRDNEKN